MPRKKRILSDYESVDLQERVANPTEREPSPEVPDESHEDITDTMEPEFYNICCCRRYTILPKPSVRKMSTIERHVRMYGNADGGPYEVRIFYFTLSKLP
jgi:hypothetical protein